MSAEPLTLLALEALILLTLTATVLSALAAAAQGPGRKLTVRVAGGYRPQPIRAAAGAPLRIVFDRRETDPCSGTVVFPDLDLHATLAPHARTTIELPTLPPGEYRFHCGRGRLRGALLVAPPVQPPERSPALLPRVRWP